MSNILLVEPDYRSKFPPLGLLRLSTFHKSRGDTVTFTRGKNPVLRLQHWHRVYISSLFTYELPRTVATIKYYIPCVENPSEDILVGGIGATLLPEYIKDQVPVRVIEGPLDKANMIGPDTPPISLLVPDYGILSSVPWEYKPTDSYFCRITQGCIRNCSFCAVPSLEPSFGYLRSLRDQLREIDSAFGEKQNLVLLDNNILAIENFDEIIAEIRESGFVAGAKRNNKKRTVDFNQGIDARLITPTIANLLASICLDPVRLAFDFDGMEGQYRKAIKYLVDAGLRSFTNYVMFNFNDTPLSLYKRMRINIDLSEEHNILITSFPMRFIPIDDVIRHYVSKGWKWRYLRGIQCVLNATHGMVSPNTSFFEGAFGKSYEEFIEIISMPDRYIIHRNKFKDHEAKDWFNLFRRLTFSERDEFLDILGSLNRSEDRNGILLSNCKYAPLFEHYYPNGDAPHD